MPVNGVVSVAYMDTIAREPRAVAVKCLWTEQFDTQREPRFSFRFVPGQEDRFPIGCEPERYGPLERVGIRDARLCQPFRRFKIRDDFPVIAGKFLGQPVQVFPLRQHKQDAVCRALPVPAP